ncbi:hypothetical protein CTEN210_02835 [Chaetoceros tenuissimus]|uniref:Uncharacterized protein n=1 Tax=Chaetoceros tenuissimus TaxID=426638 RepID=A0AAD3CI99_9STRA|nr:hypothetical protein CTEN210_02835 [Chaetoceros tenuissimus]
MPSLTQELLDLELQLKCIREEILGEWKDETCLKDVSSIVQETKDKLLETFGQSLHKLNDFKPPERTVQTVIQKFPSALSIVNEKGQLPIQSIVWAYNSVKYTPILAREGVKHDVGGKDGRGGLLTQDPSWQTGSMNTLQILASNISPNASTNDYFLNTMKQLKNDELFEKKDVFEHDLIFYTSRKKSISRFEYILNLDPQCLLKFTMNGKPYMHAAISYWCDVDDFKAILQVTMAQFPDKAGYLFQRDSDERSAFQAACDEFGETETMTVIHDVISPDKSFPILHHALTEEPTKGTLFTQWFPWAYNLRNRLGQSLIQAILAAGPTSVNDNTFVFAAMTDDQIQEKDPITTLYPFAAVASGEEGDLEKSFYLLRRQPGVLDEYVLQPALMTRKKKKRKRNDVTCLSDSNIFHVSNK